MKKYLLLLAVVIMPLMASAQVNTWKNDPAHSRMGFSVKHLGISEVSGYFADFETIVTHTKADYSDMNVKVVAKVASINTGIGMRDNHLKNADFFDAGKYPEILFVSTRVDKIDENNGKLYGNLTMHGVTKAVVLDIAYYGTVTNPMSNQQTAGFKVTGTVDRKEFGIGESFVDSFISDKVSIVVDAEFVPENK